MLLKVHNSVQSKLVTLAASASVLDMVAMVLLVKYENDSASFSSLLVCIILEVKLLKAMKTCCFFELFVPVSSQDLLNPHKNT